MSLKPTNPRDIPEETVRVAKAAFPKGNLAIFLRDELEGLYNDELFADVYPEKGKPAEAPWRLAVVTILQFAEDYLRNLEKATRRFSVKRPNRSEATLATL